MLSFAYENPVRVYFEEGACGRAGELLPTSYHSVLLVCAEGPFRRNGLYDSVRESFERAGATVHGMADIASNPKLAGVYEGVQAAREAGADCVVALGGGSAIDCAKLIARCAKTGEDPHDCVWGGRAAPAGALDTVMIPTIAATGTELNNTAVIVNENTREKYWCNTCYPTFCVLDPLATASLPVQLTVWGGMDVLSHTFEYYFNGYQDSELQLGLSEALIRSVMGALEVLVEEPGHAGMRGELLWSSAVTWGSGLTKIGRGDPDMACHSIEESFSGFFDTHHGACLGVLTPRWMRLAAAKRPAPFARFARTVMGVAQEDDRAAAEQGIDAYIAWLKRIHAPRGYADLSATADFSPENLNTVAANAWRIYGGRIGRLVALSFEEVTALVMAGLEPI